MTRPVGELGKEVKNLHEEYFGQLDKLKETCVENSPADLELLKTLKAIILNYTYLKSISDLCIEPDAETMPKLLSSSLEKLYPICIEYYEHKANAKTSGNNQSELVKQLHEVNVDMSADISLILNIAAFDSFKLCLRFVEMHGLEIVFKYLSAETLLDAYVDAAAVHDHTSPRFKCIDNIMRRAIGALVCLARTYTSFKNEWKAQNAVKKFLRYLERTKSILDNKIYACMAIAFVADDEDIEQLPQLKDTIPDLIRMAATAASLIKDDPNLKRGMVQLDDNASIYKEVCCVNHMDTLWSLINILKALYHLSVSDKLKYDIYIRHGLSKHLRSIIYNGNEVEKEYSLMVLWQLCFDKQIAQDVLNDTELHSYLNQLSANEKGGLQKNASGVLWILKKSLSTTPLVVDEAAATKAPPLLPEPQKQAEQAEPSKLRFTQAAEEINRKHIMISYNRDSRDLCLRIKAELEKEGYLVWIDVEDISGSSLESMANAIENSVCVLMCMTEKYKQSTNCRAEGEYSFNLNKPIIPLIMQKDYKPDGWLGIILGSKIFIHFMKYDFEECMRRLKIEINAVYKSNQIKAGILEIFKPEPEKPKLNNEQQVYLESVVPPAPPATTSEPPKQQQHAQRPQPSAVVLANVKELNWTESQALKWFAEKKIDHSIVKNLSPCDGRVLYELFMIKNETPEFFYKSIGFVNNSFKSPSLREIALFSYELKKLFTA